MSETPTDDALPPSTPVPRQIVAEDPADMTGELKAFGGSQSDSWNTTLIEQAVKALATRNSDPATLQRQYTATMAALRGIAPRDELEGMMAGQLLAAHNAAMDCFRRASLPGQNLEGRREALNQASKLSRTWATLLDALNKHRGKGQQRVTVEHVHVHAGGQAVVGVIERSGPGAPGGGGSDGS